MEPIEFDVNPTQRDYFLFNMRHTYTSFHGIISIIIGIAVIVIAIITRERLGMQYFLMYLVLAVLFLLYYPVHYWLGGKRLAAMMALNGGLHLSAQDDGIHVSMNAADGSGMQTEVMTWEMFYLALATKEYIYLYSSRVNAYIVPKTALGDELDAFVKLLNEKLPEHRRKLQ